VATPEPESGSRGGANRRSRGPRPTTKAAGRATGDDGVRTRGGWTPVGTAAERRAVHTERGTARGERTRRLIIDAARRVFERDGYLDVGVPDIVKEAGVSHGSFYTYFPSKLEVFRVVCAEVADAVDRAVRERPAGRRADDAIEALCMANLRYINAYRENARIYALLEQLGHIDDELHQSSHARRRRNIDRLAQVIRRWQAAGLADPTVEPTSTATALISMISNVCYWLFVAQDDDRQFDDARLSDTVNELWIRAVDLRRHPNPAWLPA
jgi:AcrR family transcriptional regulator